MAVPLDERILDLIVTKLLTITIGNGYEQTVVTAARPPAGSREFAVSQCPAVAVRHAGKPRTRWHLRGAEEFDLAVDLACTVESTSDAAETEALLDLMNDVKKLANANVRWNDGVEDLAVRTVVVQDAPFEVERREATVAGVVGLLIRARAERATPSSVKVI